MWRTVIMTLVISALYTKPFIEIMLSLLGFQDFISLTDEAVKNILFAGMSVWCATLGRFSFAVAAPIAVANRLGFLSFVGGVEPKEKMGMDELLTFAMFALYCSLVHNWSRASSGDRSSGGGRQPRTLSPKKTYPSTPREKQLASKSPGSSSPKKGSVGKLSTEAINDAKAEQQRRIEERIAKLSGGGK